MKEQSYSSHSQYVPLYHFVAGFLILSGLIGSVINFVRAFQHGSGRIVAGILVAIFIVAVLFYWFIRFFALRAQDRAIRAEENLRYYSLTGKLLDPSITMGQVIALRFAPDEEFIVLAGRAVKEGLNPSDIKRAIITWKADYHRV